MGSITCLLSLDADQQVRCLNAVFLLVLLCSLSYKNAMVYIAMESVH